jgi:LuxR family transcriptional regulator, maltose regulon positive regulatory protein
VTELVRRQRLRPRVPPLSIDAWPWPVEVTTLGRFGVLRERAPLVVGGRTRQVPLRLLKALVALGPTDVSADGLAEAVWPDADADAARQVFDTTLHRLRKLLGSDQAIRVSDGMVWIDPWSCRVDLHVLGELATRLESAIDAGDAVAVARDTEGVLAVYRGAFLPGEGAPWVVPPRERARRQFLRLIVAAGRFWMARGEPGRAVDVAERGLDRDDLAEELYRLLMDAHAALGRPGEARLAFERCRRVLAARLGTAPAPETARTLARVVG